MATLRASDHCMRGSMVLAIFPLVSRRRGTCGRAWSVGGSYDDLAVSTAVRTRTQQAVPSGTEAHQQFLEGRRNVRARGERVELSLSRRGFDGRDDRLLVFNRARCGRHQALLPASLAESGASPAACDQCRRQPSYPKVITELKQERSLGRRCRCRTCPYLNNNVEQDHRAIKRRVNASQGFRSLEGAWRTLQGYEVLHMIRKGQVRWLPKGDVIGAGQFINEMFGLKAA